MQGEIVKATKSLVTRLIKESIQVYLNENIFPFRNYPSGTAKPKFVAPEGQQLMASDVHPSATFSFSDVRQGKTADPAGNSVKGDNAGLARIADTKNAIIGADGKYYVRLTAAAMDSLGSRL